MPDAESGCWDTCSDRTDQILVDASNVPVHSGIRSAKDV